MTDQDTDTHMQDVSDMVLTCRRALGGKNPAAQGAALAELVSLYLAGHRESIREGVFQRWLELMADLTAINVELRKRQG